MIKPNNKSKILSLIKKGESSALEFFNPGRLAEGLTVEKLLADDYSPKARNKLINLMFKEAGLVEKYGSGIKRIVENCKTHGSCKVQFENVQHGFRVVLSKLEKPVKVTENSPVSGPVNGPVSGPVNRLDEIVSLIGKNPKITMLQIAKFCGVGLTTVKRDLNSLKKQGVIVRVGSDKKGYWKLVKQSGGNKSE